MKNMKKSKYEIEGEYEAAKLGEEAGYNSGAKWGTIAGGIAAGVITGGVVTYIAPISSFAMATAGLYALLSCGFGGLAGVTFGTLYGTARGKAQAALTEAELIADVEKNTAIGGAAVGGLTAAVISAGMAPYEEPAEWKIMLLIVALATTAGGFFCRGTHNGDLSVLGESDEHGLGEHEE